MVRWFSWLGLWAGSLLAACATRIHQTSLPAQVECPSGRGTYVLPSIYPPQYLVLGSFDHPLQSKIIKEILLTSQILSSKPEVVMFVSPSSLDLAYTRFQQFARGMGLKKIKFLPAASEDVGWMQDYFESGIKLPERQLQIFEIPYDRHGNQVALSTALYTFADFISKPHYFKMGRLGDNGDFGGNIEALSTTVVAVGDNMNPVFREQLSKRLNQKIVTVNTSWLDPGHVDELFTTVPTYLSSSKCEMAMLYASPQRAFELFAKTTPRKGEAIGVLQMIYEQNEDDREDFRECLHQIDWTHLKSGSPKCRALIEANMVYQNLIDHDLKRLERELTTNQGCTLVQKKPIPLLFSPRKISQTYGTPEDRTIPMNPNAVNGISLERFFFLPDQPFEPFRHEIETVISDLGLEPKFFDISHLHALKGGLHCSTNIIRSCP